MKHNIIKTNEYLLVCDDSEIKENYHVYYPEVDEIWCKKLVVGFNKGYKAVKIIAHLPLNGAPVLDGVPLLPSLLKEDDVQKLADEASQKFKRNDELDDLILGVSANSFVEGYNKNNEKYKFTEEDLRKAMKMAQEQELVRHTDSEYRMVIAYTHSEMDIIKSLQQPKYPIAFECEMIKWVDELYCMVVEEHKTITNSEGKVEWVGKYIWE